MQSTILSPMRPAAPKDDTLILEVGEIMIVFLERVSTVT